VPLFTPPRWIQFQIEGIAYAMFKRQVVVVWDTGLGKSALAFGAICLALEDDTDHVIIVCEPNKLTEWLDDTALFTSGLTSVIYHGPRRKKLLEGRLPPVIITTYETLRNDGAHKAEGHVRKQEDGPLIEALRGKRVMVVYDEIAVLGRRSSQKYRAHQHVLLQLTKAGYQPRVIGLTATPIDTTYDNLFSVLRLAVPQAMPLVTQWDKKMIAYRRPDRFYQPVWKDEGVAWFREISAPWILRKRKTDPDVVSQFPPFTEKFVMCQMHSDQRDLYRRLEDLAWEGNHYSQVSGLSVVLRQFVGDPIALKHSKSALGQMIWVTLQNELEKCSSAKGEQLISQLEAITGNDNKAIVFTFFGQSVLKALEERLARFPVDIYHGGMTVAEKDRAKASFLSAPGGRILLASDAAARGINLPCPYVIEYEPARTPALRTQRAGRAHRLGSQLPVTMLTFFAEDSMEDGTAIPKLLDRNQQQDLVLGDELAEGYTTAEDRREMFMRARKRKTDAT
jgi:SNF2 family DNA or RNA helicase